MGAFFSRNNSNVIDDLKVLTGKVVIVTGGNTGIGYETVKILARRGAKVYMAARNESKAMEAIASLLREGLGDLGGEVVWLKLELDDPRAAVESAQEFLGRENRLDILINNAAQLTGPPDKTPDGILKLMMVNHIAPFAFSNILLPLLIKTAQEPDSDVRIISLASIAYNHAKGASPELQFRTVDDFNGDCEDWALPEWARYSVSKLANILSIRALQKRLDAVNIPIICISLHPGAVNTFASRLQFPMLSGIFMGLFFVKPEVGAYTSCIAAASLRVQENPEMFKGAYLTPFGVIEPLTGNAARDELVEDLWTLTERVLSDLGVRQESWRKVSEDSV